jgi:hypothetical protein
VGTLTNITATTYEDMVYRTGTVTVAGASVGALEGDISVKVTKEDHIPELAGAAGEVKGTRFRMKEELTIAFQCVRWQLTGIATAIVGMRVSSNASSEVIGSSDDSSDVVGCIDIAEYKTWVFEFEQCDGHRSTLTVLNAIVDGDVELKWSDKGHFLFGMTVKSTYDGADPDMRPWTWTHVYA